MPMLVVRVMKSMTYDDQEIRVIVIMLNRPRFAIAELVSDPPFDAGVGGGVGVSQQPLAWWVWWLNYWRAIPCNHPG